MTDAVVNIHGGSEKQNAWGQRIAEQWIADLDAEIATTAGRAEADGLVSYLAALRAKRVELLTGFGRATAKQLIDLHVAKRNPVTALIKAAREASR
jgi:phage terminase Nu1 subunit (DNA packaging protein)